MAYKMKGFSGFKNSPMKQGKIGGLKQFMKENDAVLRDKKGKIIDTSKYSNKDWEKLDYEINQKDKMRLKKMWKKAKKVVGRAAGMFSMYESAKGIFEGYKELSKQRHGKQIIKDSGIGRTRKI